MKTKFLYIGLSFFSLFVVTLTAVSQEYKFDLNKFYTPNIVRNSLDLDFNGLSSTTKNTSESILWQKETTTNFRLDGSLNSRFIKFTDTRKKQSTFQVGLNLSGKLDNSSGETITDSNPKTNLSNSNVGLLVSIDNTYYKQNRFISFGFYAEAKTLNENSKRETQVSVSNTDKRDSQTLLNSFIGIGMGRMETVTEARQALYILADLSNKSVLSRHLSDDEISKFAQLIAKVKNKRILDSRLRKIEEITAVDSFLVHNNLLTRSDVSYFTTLYDNWENGANFSRKSGQVFELRLTPYFSAFQNKEESKVSNPVFDQWSKRSYNIYGAYLTLSYRYSKQLGLNWEKTANLSFSGSVDNYENKSSTDKISEYVIDNNQSCVQMIGNYNIGYYPNTRTNLTLGISQALSKLFFNQSEKFTQNSSINSLSRLTASVVYYVSPQLSISGRGNVDYQFEKNNYTHGELKHRLFGGGISATIRYSFF